MSVGQAGLYNQYLSYPRNPFLNPVLRHIGEINPQGVRFISVGIEGIAGYECNVVLKTLFKQRNRINGII